jgi:hypothetical protein
MEMLSLQPLAPGRHGYGNTEWIKGIFGDVLPVGEVALYPPLQRVQFKRWVKAKPNHLEEQPARVITPYPLGRNFSSLEAENFQPTNAATIRVKQTT